MSNRNVELVDTLHAHFDQMRSVVEMMGITHGEPLSDDVMSNASTLVANKLSECTSLLSEWYEAEHNDSLPLPLEATNPPQSHKDKLHQSTQDESPNDRIERHLREAKAIADLIMSANAVVGADSLMQDTLATATVAIYNHLDEIEKAYCEEGKS